MKKSKKSKTGSGDVDPRYVGDPWRNRWDLSALPDVEEDMVILAITAYMFRGQTLEVFMADHMIRKSKWDKWIRHKNRKEVREAIVDGMTYYKAHWQELGYKWARDKNRSQTISKMLIEHALGWNDAAVSVDVGGGGGYKVIIEQPVPLPPMDGNGIPLSMLNPDGSDDPIPRNGNGNGDATRMKKKGKK